jgi:hypothetical protein
MFCERRFVINGFTLKVNPINSIVCVSVPNLVQVGHIGLATFASLYRFIFLLALGNH